jgi:hypothetical protein
MVSRLSLDYMKLNKANHADELFDSLIMMTATKPKERMVLIDYGGGSGMLSMQAKRMGIGTVIYCDLVGQMCSDAREIAKTKELEADHYVQGDIDDLIEYLQKHKLEVDAICSHDVIEHIVDLEYFAKRLMHVPHNKMTCSLSSGANLYNPLILYRTLRAHRIAKEAYKTITGPYLSTWLNPRHPKSGYWPEHLMRINYIQRVFKMAGFDVTITPGTYTRSNWRKVINPAILFLGYMVSPYLIVHLTTP